MAPKDLRQENAGTAGGGFGGAGVAGKSTLTGAIVQKKDAVPDLTYHPKQAEHISDAVDAFRDALDRKDPLDAKNKWAAMKKPDRIAWSKSSTFARDFGLVKSVMGAGLLDVMDGADLTFASQPGLLTELLNDTSAKHDWLLSISHHPALWLEFTHTLGDRASLTEQQGKSIGKLIMGQDSMGAVKNDIAVVKKLFAYIYAPLRDDSYDSNRVHTRPWKMEWIQRLYKVLSSHLPIGHVQTVKDFAIGFEEKEKGETKFKPLHNAWWNHDRHVILNEGSAKSKEGEQVKHNMTGGTRSSKKMDKFDVGALHEVGHGVGQELGGNDWTMAHPWVGWQIKQSYDDWSKGLWGSDGDLKQRAWDKLGEKADVLDASEARIYLAHRISNKTYTPTTPGFAKPKDVESFIRKHYADQKLTKYWEQVMKKGDRSKAYRFENDDNIGEDNRVYVYLTRGDSHLSSYNAVAYQKRVSDYSTSSPKEWWAEQYAHYYRLNRTGSGLDADTKAKLDELHGARFEDPDGLMKPDSDAPAGDSNEDAGDRLPFPW